MTEHELAEAKMAQEAEKGRRVEHARRIVLRMMKRELANAFRALISRLQTLKVQRIVVGRVVMRIKHRRCAAAWDRWLEQQECWRRVRVKMAKCLTYMTHRSQRAAWTRWGEGIRRRRVGDKACSKLRRLTVHKAWGRWEAGVAEVQRMRQMAAKVCARCLHRSMSRAWLSWLHALATLQQRREHLHHSFAGWTRAVLDAKRQQQDVEKEDMVTMLADNIERMTSEVKAYHDKVIDLNAKLNALSRRRRSLVEFHCRSMRRGLKSTMLAAFAECASRGKLVRKHSEIILRQRLSSASAWRVRHSVLVQSYTDPGSRHTCSLVLALTLLCPCALSVSLAPSFPTRNPVSPPIWRTLCADAAIS